VNCLGTASTCHTPNSVQHSKNPGNKIDIRPGNTAKQAVLHIPTQDKGLVGARTRKKAHWYFRWAPHPPDQNNAHAYPSQLPRLQPCLIRIAIYPPLPKHCRHVPMCPCNRCRPTSYGTKQETPSAPMQGAAAIPLTNNPSVPRRGGQASAGGTRYAPRGTRTSDV
jgi:hypothetical protein